MVIYYPVASREPHRRSAIERGSQLAERDIALKQDVQHRQAFTMRAGFSAL